MDVRYDLWHLAFANLIQHRAPPGFEIQTEVRLTIEPQRADMLLLRRIGAAHDDDKAQVMRTLWPLLGRVTILEYKSPVRGSFRPRDLIRLWSYGAVYDAAHPKELPSPRDLTLVLVVPSVTPTLTREIARMGWTLTALGGGYGRIDGAVYPLYVVATDEVSQADHDEFLRLFSRLKAKAGEAARWLVEWMKEMEMAQTNIREMEGYRAMLLKSMPAEERLEGLDPEDRLAGLPPEVRLAGLDRDQQALALPVEILRALPESYILSLAPETQEKIRQRLAAADH
jgi:hypothetical protein